MDTWYSKSLGDGMSAHAPSIDINRAYLEYVLVHGENTGAAVFSRLDLDTGIVTAYFTPEAVSLAKKFGAEPCTKPVRDKRLGLLAGSRLLDWAKHFPE